VNFEEDENDSDRAEDTNMVTFTTSLAKPMRHPKCVNRPVDENMMIFD